MKDHEIDDHGLAPTEETAPGDAAPADNTCPSCGGSGAAPSGEVCPTCGGLGVIRDAAGGG